jgi:flagellar basal body rod protein FlgG
MESARHAVIANNLANVNTVGFRDDMAVVMARNAEAKEAALPAYSTSMDGIGGGALLSETYTRPVQGTINVTEHALDLAIEGEGFFAVTDGETVTYTRAGSFTRDTAGRLAMPDGKHFLCDLAGSPLTLPLEGEAAIAKDGTVTVNRAVAGKIDIYRFSDPRALAKAGSNLYTSAEAPSAGADAGQIRQGALEMSTVSPTSELAKMIIASRGYEMNMQLIRLQDQTVADLISVGRPSI